MRDIPIAARPAPRAEPAPVAILEFEISSRRVNRRAASRLSQMLTQLREAWAWIVSSAGALLFFAAGSLFTLRAGALRRRDERNAREHERAELERVRLERQELRAALAEAEQERGAARAPSTDHSG